MLFYAFVLPALGVVVRTDSSGKSSGPVGWITNNLAPDNRLSTRDISPEQVGLSKDTLDEMVDRSADVKRAALWDKITGNATSGEFHKVGGEAIMKFIRTNYLWQTQNTYSDELPVNHKKYIHPVGMVGKTKFKWNEAAKRYTGLFKKADQCMVRFSSAAKPYPLLPGMGLKCLRTNAPSGNFVAMWQLDGFTVEPASMPNRKKSCKFFGVPFSNHVAVRDTLSYGVKIPAHFTFARVATKPGFRWDRLWETGAPNMIGLSSFASAEEDGKAVAEGDVNFPFALVFTPTEAVAALPCSDTATGLGQVANIKSGMDIYDVWAVHNPEQVGSLNEENVVKIGTLTAESEFTTSKFGDDRLFIRHDFYGKDVDAMTKADAARGKMFSDIWTDNAFMKTEGAQKYEDVIKLKQDVHAMNELD